jgi:hypothetical protein
MRVSAGGPHHVLIAGVQVVNLNVLERAMHMPRHADEVRIAAAGGLADLQARASRALFVVVRACVCVCAVSGLRV